MLSATLLRLVGALVHVGAVVYACVYTAEQAV